MSPYKPICCHHGLRLVRPLNTQTKGVKHWDCEVLELYGPISGRVGESRSIEENRLQDSNPPYRHGDDKADERVVMLCPNYPLLNITAGDWLQIPWGVRPNTFSPVPGLAGLGPNVWINTPTGEELLTWTWDASGDGTGSFMGSVQIYQQDGEWFLDDGTATSLGSLNFVCAQFPEGYSFIRSTGPSSNHKILKIDEKLDAECRISHYSIHIEHIDQEYSIIQ